MKHIVLADWSEFEESLRANLYSLGHTGLVIARNFATRSMTPDLVETNRLELVLGTGTDRSADSLFWNVPGFDHDHVSDPKGKQPHDIAYAFTLDLAATPYFVLHDAQPSSFDLTEGLTPYDGLVVYHPRGLDRVSKNEYWFICDPLDVALFVFTLSYPDGEI